MKRSIGILAMFSLISCSTPELEKETQLQTDLYPTEKCTLSWYGDGKLILIDKSKGIGDTIVKSSLNGTSDIDLVVRGYYELKIIGCTHVEVLITNSSKEILNRNLNTNGLTSQFFNK